MNILKTGTFFLIVLCVVTFAYTPMWRGDFLDDKIYDCGDNADGLEIGDIDGDGKNELVVGNRGSEDFSIFKRVDGVIDSVAPYYTHELKYAMGVIHIADINGDDLNDVILAHYTDYTSGTPKDDKFGVCYQNATTNMLDPETEYDLPNGTSARALGVGDLDSDGKPEIVVANEGSGSSLFVFGWNDNKGDVELEQTKGGISGQTISITVADVTGDGKPDVVTHGGGGKVYVQNSSGTLDNADTYSQTGGESADVGDINQDGLNDVVGATAYGEGIDIFEQTTSGTLTKTGTRNCGGYTEDCELIDLNDDGLTDVAVASRDRSELWVFYQESSGGLPQTPAKYIGVQGKWLNELAVGDLNGNGCADVAGSNWGDNGVGQIYPASVSVWFYDKPVSTHQTKQIALANSLNVLVSKSKIKFNLRKDSRITLIVSDIAGRQHSIVSNEFKTAGDYIFSWEKYQGCSGVYFITLKAGKDTVTKRFVIVK